MVDELLGSPPVPNSSDSHSQPSPLHNLNTVNQPFSINIAPMDQSLRMGCYRFNCRLRRQADGLKVAASYARGPV